MSPVSEESQVIQLLRQAIIETRVIRFFYNDLERIVDPYVLGVSSQGNPLLRGYQEEGESLSGKGPGWRVFQVRNMVEVDFEGEWFLPVAQPYDPYVTWIYEVDTQIT